VAQWLPGRRDEGSTRAKKKGESQEQAGRYEIEADDQAPEDDERPVSEGTQ
jgi:hypothetical protein